jgi:DNA polymerase-3 subunit gamma/tau
MSYLPIARKYRPKTFEDLIGQPHVTTTLIRAIESGRIGQAYLFTGQRGVGKTSAARILAISLNCAKGPTVTPCGECASCQAIVRGNSLDVIEIDGASNRGIDDIRQLREQVKFAPVHGQFRVYIIDEVHQITTDAFNALLKTLEEPPPHVKFIFATTAPNKVPSTILSRCQRFDFRRQPAATVVSVLHRIATAEGVQAEEPALYAIAAASEGSLRDAEVIFEQVISFAEGAITEADVNLLLGAVEQDALLTWAQHLLDRRPKDALLMLHEQLDRGKDVMQLVTGLIGHVRNLIVARASDASPESLAQLVELPAERLAKLRAQAAPHTPEELLMMAQVLTGAYDWMRRTPFAQAILEFALITMATRESWASLPELIERLDRLAQGTSGTAASHVAAAPQSPAPARAAVPSHAPAPARPAARPTSAVTVGVDADVAAKAEARSGPGSPASSSVAVEEAAIEEVADVAAETPPATAVPGAPPGSPLEVLTLAWPKVVDRLGKLKMHVAAYLMEGRPLQLTGGIAQIGLPIFSSLHRDVLTAADNQRLVERLITEVAGLTVTVRYSKLPDTDAPRRTSGLSAPGLDAPIAPVPPILKEIVSLFDATIVPTPPPVPPAQPAAPPSKPA